MLTCVVCGAAIGDGAEQYANTYEKVRKRYPCCAGCVARFDLDAHWLPARRPEPMAGAEQVRMSHVFEKRLREGDRPRVLVREMLLAGLDPAHLRRTVQRIAGSAAEAQQRAARSTVLGVLGAIFAGRGKVAEARDQRSARDFAEALEDVDAWDGATAPPA